MRAAFRRSRPERIIIVDDSERFITLCKRWLVAAGYHRITCFGDGSSLLNDRDRLLEADLLLLDIHLDNHLDGLQVLKQARQIGYRGLAVVISGDSSMEQCFRAARSGANDFLLKRPTVNVAEEISTLLSRSQREEPTLSPNALSNLGYLRSFGLTDKEIEMLEAYATDYCSQQELALRLNKAEGHVRKTFSRIYRKLQVDGLSQLVHVLTSCALFSVKC